MSDFAFVVHPMDVENILQKFPFLGRLPHRVVEGCFRHLPPFRIARVKNITSRASGQTISGLYVVCPLTSRQMLSQPEPHVLKRIIGAGKLAQKAGVRIVGLGALTSVIGDAGISVSQALRIPVTTGNSLTVAMALEGAKKASSRLGIDVAEAEVVVIGATGSIGAVCAQLMARECRYMTLVARDRVKLSGLAKKILHDSGQAVRVTTDIPRALSRAHIVITVSSSAGDLVQPEYLVPGTVVCDVARPRDVSRRVAEERKDVLVIEGGLVEVPGEVSTDLDLGYPPNVTLACVAETMVLALEGKFESYTLGRELEVDKVEKISIWARKHGFCLAGLRSFDRAVTDEEIMWIKKNGRRKKAAGS